MEEKLQEHQISLVCLGIEQEHVNQEKTNSKFYLLFYNHTFQ